MIAILACGMVILGVKWTTKENDNNRMLILEMQVTDFARVDSWVSAPLQMPKRDDIEMSIY